MAVSRERRKRLSWIRFKELCLFTHPSRTIKHGPDMVRSSILILPNFIIISDNKRTSLTDMIHHLYDPPPPPLPPLT
jgi:hypothetical protein